MLGAALLRARVHAPFAAGGAARAAAAARAPARAGAQAFARSPAGALGRGASGAAWPLRAVAVRAHSTAAEAAEEEPAKKPRRALRERKAAIELTDAAVARIKTLLEGKPNAKGVLLGVRRRGCNGLSYTLNYAEKVGKLDDVVEKGGVTVVIDPKALMHLIGTVMDYQEDEISAEFKFINPNAKGSCGCGESFST